MDPGCSAGDRDFLDLTGMVAMDFTLRRSVSDRTAYACRWDARRNKEVLVFCRSVRKKKL